MNQGFYNQLLSEGDCDLGIPTQEEEGLGLSVALVGFGGSSTRSEIAGGIIAIAADGPVHIGTDSQAFCNKATSLIDMERRGRKPKRPWSTQKDGDLWELLHKMVQQKGWKSVKITKVKGHATDANVEDGKVDINDKKGNDKADDYATKGLNGHADDFLKVSRLLTKRQISYVAFVTHVHDHMLEAFFRRKLLLDAEHALGDEKNDARAKKFIQVQPIDYPGEGKPLEHKEMLGVQHIGKTGKEFHKTEDVYDFVKMLPAEATEDYKEALTWQELFILYEMVGGRNIIGRPISAAKKRAPMAKRIQGFKKCAGRIIKNCLNDEDAKLFRPLEVKKPKLKQTGITTRIAATSCKVALTKEAQRTVNKHLITMQNNYNGRTVEKIIAGDKCVKLTKLNSKGKAEWAESVGKASFQIFPNITGEQIDIAKSRDEVVSSPPPAA